MAVTKLTASQQQFVDAIIAGVEQEAKKGLVAAASKPELVIQLRKTWRKSAEHLAEQLARFMRLFLLGAPVPIVDVIVKGTGHFDWETLLVALVPVGETAWRQVFPALGAAKVDQAPGVTIVPSQVDPQAVDIPVDAGNLDGGGQGEDPVGVAGDDAPDPAP